MFTNSVNKEFVFSLFLKFYPEVILDLTGYDIPKLELEKNYNGRKIDIFGEMYKRDVFIENQITKADERHFQQVEFIIENVQASKNTTIIWTAENFDREMIERVQRKIDGSGKNIEFIAIRINKELIAELDNYTNNLNTSYVTVKQKRRKISLVIGLYLNTSYVTVKPIQNSHSLNSK